MTVTCERCGTSFRIEDDKIAPKGANVRCGKCGFVFFASVENKSFDGEIISNLQSDLESMSQNAIQENQALPLQNDSPTASKENNRDPVSTPLNSLPASPPTQAVKKITKKTATSASAYPVYKPPEIPLKQKYLRILVVALIFISGLTFGLIAMGIPPKPQNILLLLNFGQKKVPKTVGVVNYKGEFLVSTSQEKIFSVVGNVFNPKDKESPPLKLRLTLLTPEGEFLTQTIGFCCKGGIPPRSLKPFSLQATLKKNIVVGSYFVTVQP